jgi:hypothetical protein
LGGARRRPPAFQPLVRTDRPIGATGVALHVARTPALDGTLEGFDVGEPLELDHEDQYRRSEEPYPGSEEFSARAYVNWNDEGLYLGVEVTKPEVFARDPGAASLRLDNEPDEIHGDGVQVYLGFPSEGQTYGLLLVPSAAGDDLIIRPVAETSAAAAMVQGSWRANDTGYILTAKIAPPGWEQLRASTRIEFDLLINHMIAGRLRRAGQLVWSGGGGWVWLRGDRQDPARFGTLELR